MNFSLFAFPSITPLCVGRCGRNWVRNVLRNALRPALIGPDVRGREVRPDRLLGNRDACFSRNRRLPPVGKLDEQTAGILAGKGLEHQPPPEWRWKMQDRQA